MKRLRDVLAFPVIDNAQRTRRWFSAGIRGIREGKAIVGDGSCVEIDERLIVDDDNRTTLNSVQGGGTAEIANVSQGIRELGWSRIKRLIEHLVHLALSKTSAEESVRFL